MTTPLRTISANDLKVILADHRLWVSSVGTQGKRADLSGAYLSGANLTEANLNGADLIRANLNGADLRDANLTEANLRDANLRDANLSGAYLSGANLTYANLSNAILYGANLREADLSEADLTEANLDNADLSGANLTYANLSNAILYGANISGADLSGADLSGAIVSEPWKIVDGKLVQHVQVVEQAVLQTGAVSSAEKSNNSQASIAELSDEIRKAATKLEDAAKLLRIEHELAFKALSGLPGGEHIVNALRLEAANRLNNNNH